MEKQARDAEALMARANNQHEVLAQATLAAELYMKAAGVAQTHEDRSRLIHKCKELIEYAEGIKTGRISGASPAIRVRQISTWEQTILVRSSKLHGNLFPPWCSEPDPTTFILRPGGEAFVDETPLPLSRQQQDVFAGWKRPSELFDMSLIDPTKRDPDLFMQAWYKSDLVQDVTADCSVVASLSSAMNLMRSRNHSILSRIFYPYDNVKGRPALSSSGKYILRMNFNGCFRKVEIDDRLPSSNTDRALFVIDIGNPFLIWPALVEKAYLKVRGGYDFPGSNSCTDLWIVTGWIPDQIFLQNHELDLEETWSTISSAFRLNNVIITLGTGRISKPEEEAIGLVGEHDYGVLELDEALGNRRLLVKNPWCSAGSNTGLAAPVAAPPLRALIRDIPPHDHRNATPSPSRVGLGSGSFWMAFEDVSQNFESMYLNWNPESFTHRQDHHFRWEVTPKQNMTATIVDNPQYAIVSHTGGPIWILLSRHFADEELHISRQRPDNPDTRACRLGFISLGVFKNCGKVVQKIGSSGYIGPYVDSPQTLAKITTEKGEAYTVVPLQDKLPLPSYSFTLSLFSLSQLDIVPAKHCSRYYVESQGAWSRRTAGGNSNSSNYGSNPQFRITVPEPTPLSALLCTDNFEIAVHIDLVWARGERVDSPLTTKNLLADSGEYTRGCATLEVARVDVGTYTIVCSTFEEGQLADFTLRLGAHIHLDLKRVPSEGAGQVRTLLPAILFAEGEDCYKARISADRLSRACAMVPYRPSSSSCHRLKRAPASMVRISLSYGVGPMKTVLSVSGSGEFREQAAGVRTDYIDIEHDQGHNEGLWLVVERQGRHCNSDSVEVVILSDVPVSVGGWEREF